MKAMLQEEVQLLRNGVAMFMAQIGKFNHKREREELVLETKSHRSEEVEVSLSDHTQEISPLD